MQLRFSIAALASALMLASPSLAHDAAHTAPAADTVEVKAGDIIITGAFARATLPNQHPLEWNRSGRRAFASECEI